MLRISPTILISLISATCQSFIENSHFGFLFSFQRPYKNLTLGKNKIFVKFTHILVAAISGSWSLGLKVTRKLSKKKKTIKNLLFLETHIDAYLIYTTVTGSIIYQSNMIKNIRFLKKIILCYVKVIANQLFKFRS